MSEATLAVARVRATRVNDRMLPPRELIARQRDSPGLPLDLDRIVLLAERKIKQRQVAYLQNPEASERAGACDFS
jgi:hypothetical protein